MLDAILTPIGVKALAVLNGTGLGTLAAIEAVGSADPIVAVVGAIGGLVGATTMMLLWAKFITKGQAEQVRSLAAQLLAEREENSRLHERLDRGNPRG